MDLLTGGHQWHAFGFGTWVSFLILGGITILIFILGNTVLNFVDRQK